MWYSVSSEEVLRRFGVTLSGLSHEQVKQKRAEYGENSICLSARDTPLIIFFRQINNPIVILLLLAALVAFSLGKIEDSLVVLLVVLANSLIGFFQEYKAHKTVQALQSIIPVTATVIREGAPIKIPSKDVVPGDIVVLESGDRVVADLRLLAVKNFHCDESILTGESVPVTKTDECLEKDLLLAERKNMAFNGTLVTSGNAQGVVVATGKNSELGRISELVGNVVEMNTPLTVMLKKLASWITLRVVGVTILMFLVGLFRGSHFVDTALASIALAVAAIPEGLPAVITIASSIGVKRMAAKNAIIRELPAVEALGSTTVICTDKTGTLTVNEMTVQKIWTVNGFSFLSGIGYWQEGRLEETSDRENVIDLLKCALLCSNGSIVVKDGKNEVVGDPTEISILVAARKCGLKEQELKKNNVRLDEIPFESERRLMATLYNNWIYVKGAPEEVLAICACADVSVFDRAKKVTNQLATDGMRTLAVAKKWVPQEKACLEESDVKNEFVFLGLLAIVDPPRNEVGEAISACHQAGIQVKIVTGDHPLTAFKIAQEIGAVEENQSVNECCITGKELLAASEQDWEKFSTRYTIFARTSPEHKLQLVTALQKQGHIVAMTGDGVNDAPALKKADIGIAMGRRGTAVAQEASGIILADDNFATIKAAVEEGRRVYDNLVKSLVFILPTSFAQALVILISFLFFPVQSGVLLQPILPVQILWINLVIAVCLALPIAFEEQESDIMKRKPREKGSIILNHYFVFKIAVTSVLMALGAVCSFLWEYNVELAQGVTTALAVSEAQTIAVLSLTLMQVLYLFNCRSFDYQSMKKNFFSNRYLFYGVGCVLISTICFIYLPALNSIFKSMPLDFGAWLVAIFSLNLLLPLLLFEQRIKKWKFFSS